MQHSTVQSSDTSTTYSTEELLLRYNQNKTRTSLQPVTNIYDLRFITLNATLSLLLAEADRYLREKEMEKEREQYDAERTHSGEPTEQDRDRDRGYDAGVSISSDSV